MNLTMWFDTETRSTAAVQNSTIQQVSRHCIADSTSPTIMAEWYSSGNRGNMEEASPLKYVKKTNCRHRRDLSLCRSGLSSIKDSLTVPILHASSMSSSMFSVNRTCDEIKQKQRNRFHVDNDGPYEIQTSSQNLKHALTNERPAVAKPTIESPQKPYFIVSLIIRQLTRGNSIGWKQELRWNTAKAEALT